MEKRKVKLDVDMTQLAAILESFYTVSHIKSTLYDTEFHEILTYPSNPCSFCSMVRKQHLDRCKKSDMNAFSVCQKQQRTISYCCHIGLFEVLSPLRNGDEIIGYIMFGQMLQEEKKEETIQRILEQYPYLDERDTMKQALEKLESKSSTQIHAATLLMQTCICYLLSNRIVRVDEGNFIEELNYYVDAHISQEITVKELCRYFGMSRSSFYVLANQCIDGGVMQYIRKQRIEKAKELLRDTSKQVTEISGLVGFLDYNYFLRIFKRETGVSCREYRKGNFIS